VVILLTTRSHRWYLLILGSIEYAVWTHLVFCYLNIAQQRITSELTANPGNQQQCLHNQTLAMFRLYTQGALTQICLELSQYFKEDHQIIIKNNMYNYHGDHVMSLRYFRYHVFTSWHLTDMSV
jgi:hypothetical protein